MSEAARTLEEQREEYAHRRFLATPLTGTVVWFAVAVSSLFLSPVQTVWILFVGTGSIGYISLFVSKFTGEDFLDKSKPKNTFNSLFFYGVFSSLAVFAIAIPFFLVDYTSLPLTVGILTGTMWIPFSWIIQHPVGVIHGVSRTVFVVAAWYLFPNQRFLVIPIGIVLIYLATIYVLETRWRRLRSA
ncbi:MAG: hypothetical protein GY747_03125 [Planctomycetes bacterium]|nr:hypothetical protein [Planctomycetota bacterium]MCP4770848.1 hypothetical protein [Planctomycetota bacterium]MCP4862327.1 hypothetical protein [Planctomycetota bacterium]